MRRIRSIAEKSRVFGQQLRAASPRLHDFAAASSPSRIRVRSSQSRDHNGSEADRLSADAGAQSRGAASRRRGLSRRVHPLLVRPPLVPPQPLRRPRSLRPSHRRSELRVASHPATRAQPKLVTVHQFRERITQGFGPVGRLRHFRPMRRSPTEEAALLAYPLPAAAPTFACRPATQDTCANGCGPPCRWKRCWA